MTKKETLPPLLAALGAHRPVLSRGIKNIYAGYSWYFLYLLLFENASRRVRDTRHGLNLHYFSPAAARFLGAHWLYFTLVQLALLCLGAF